MKLLKKLEKQTPKEKEFFKQWGLTIKESPQEQYHLLISWFQTHFADFLASLSSHELQIFFSAFQKPGFELYSLDAFSKENLEEALVQLEKKCLVYATKSVQRVQQGIKVFLFSEIETLIETKFNLYFYPQILEKYLGIAKNSALSYQCPDMPLDMLGLFFSYSFFPKKEFVIQQFGNAAAQYFVEDNIIKEVVVIMKQEEEYFAQACYQLNPAILEPASFITAQNFSYQSRIFNDIIRFIYLVNRDQILITKKGEINKKQHERLAKDIPSESILWFLTRFLTHHGFVEIHQDYNYIMLTTKGYNFFQQTIEEVYEKILETDPFLKKVILLAEKTSFSVFGLADLTLIYLKEEGKKDPTLFTLREGRRKILQSLEILSYLGILNLHYNPEGHVGYSFKNRYKEYAQPSLSNQKSLILSPSMEVTAYPQELDAQTSYCLNVFSEIKKFENLIVYQLTPQSIRRALYFKLNLQDLLKTLINKAKNPMPHNMLTNLTRWAEQFKQGVLENCTLLQTQKETLDLLMHTPQYQSLILERLNDTCAKVSPNFFKQRILEEEGIFLYPQATAPSLTEGDEEETQNKEEGQEEK